MGTSHIFPLRVYIEDTDFSGVVYHANYLKYFERARSEWAEQAGLGTDWQHEQGIYLVLRYANVDYLKPALLHQQVEVVSQIAEVRKASLIYAQYLRPSAIPDTILCKAEIKIACVDRNLRPRALPSLLINYGERA
ncbi:MAG: YbgC/FadM family acyl-CoA thioesterase [Gammaproteobacteria bacterium]